MCWSRNENSNWQSLFCIRRWRHQWDDPQQLAFIKGSWLTLLVGRSDFAAAETFARDYVAWADATFGPRHSSTLSAHQGLNRILIQSSQMAEAETRLQADLQTASDWLGEDDVKAAKDAVAAKKSVPAALDLVELRRLDEGTAIQTLHVGSFDDEGPVLEKLHHEVIPSRGFVMTQPHHEIYLSDFRRVAPDKLRTILRQPVAAAD